MLSFGSAASWKRGEPRDQQAAPLAEDPEIATVPDGTELKDLTPTTRTRRAKSLHPNPARTIGLSKAVRDGVVSLFMNCNTHELTQKQLTQKQHTSQPPGPLGQHRMQVKKTSQVIIPNPLHMNSSQ
ncbi:hypothetical protein CYMTET_23877 [Cymbomonas tetramitiformis]|uniref:Uncharacterized protein n=1 Tax=Cymbomonas tetramitiformis TaxID=36881 RepID=A0AAE0L0S2_9CHLO|nr:hypothetical protein CYMTET_23877 [Cymbomonas tetramitiformis]